MSDPYEPASRAPEEGAPLDRRAFLGRFAALGLGASAFLAACGGGNGTDTGTTGQTGGTATQANGEYPVVPANDCAGYDELTDQQLQMRQSLQYEDESPREGQYCGNCRFQEAYAADQRCLGCQLFEGPVSPGGWCASWTVQTA